MQRIHLVRTNKWTEECDELSPDHHRAVQSSTRVPGHAAALNAVLSGILRVLMSEHARWVLMSTTPYFLFL